MPAVTSKVDVLSVGGVLASWVGAVAGAAFALLLAALGQGLGAVFGGCRFIGVSLAPHRQVWALVNQPTLDFAIRPAALGYWLGSLLLPLLFAALAVALLPRFGGLVSELAVVQWAWLAAVIGVAWLPVLDLEDGHLARWLFLHRWPVELVSLAPVLAAAASLPCVLRLLALLRARHRHSGRSLRLGTTVLHLLLPVAGWVALASWLRGSVPMPSAVAAAVPATAALAVAFYGYPSPHVRPLEGVRLRGLIGLAVTAVALWGLVAVAGRPLPGGDVRGWLWLPVDARNNVRPWIRPVPESLAGPRSLLEEPDGS